MGTRERDEQAEQEGQRLEQEQAQLQQRGTPRETQIVADDELSNNPVIINK